MVNTNDFYNKINVILAETEETVCRESISDTMSGK